MPTYTRDLFDDATLASPQAYLDAFESWVVAREHFGAIRERSSVAVYRSMWCALTAWCVSRGLRLDDLKPGDFEAYLHSRGGVDELTARHAWRLLMLADAVQHHRAAATGAVRNAAAHELLMATPDWRYANAADKTPLPDHLHAAEARHLVQWLLDPASATVAAGAPAHTWQALRNRAAVALQLGAGLTPGDIRAATVDGVVCERARCGAALEDSTAQARQHSGARSPRRPLGRPITPHLAGHALRVADRRNRALSSSARRAPLGQGRAIRRREGRAGGCGRGGHGGRQLQAASYVRATPAAARHRARTSG